MAAPQPREILRNLAFSLDGQLMSTGHRMADVVGFGVTLDEARKKVYTDIRKIRSLGSYYREDIGASLWPPGNG